jgi:hypothetical protein
MNCMAPIRHALKEPDTGKDLARFSPLAMVIGWDSFFRQSHVPWKFKRGTVIHSIYSMNSPDPTVSTNWQRQSDPRWWMAEAG